MSKKRAISLLLLLVIAALLISGCAPRVDAQGNVSAPTWIAILSVPLQKLIEFVYYKILTPIGLPSFGLAIILVTILIRLLLYPLTRKQMQSMKKMQAIQPKMKEIQEKVRQGSREAGAEADGAVQAGGGQPGGRLFAAADPDALPLCLLLCAAGPWVSARPAVFVDPQPGVSELWAGHGLATAADPGAPASRRGLPYLVLPILYILSQFVMQRQSQTSNPTAGGGSTNTVMMLMPLMFGYITLIVPSGLSLYWFTSNVLQIFQQGFTTGWSGIIPGKKQPASVTSGGKQTSSAQSTSITSKSTTTASAGPSASTSVISSTGELDDDTGAGRRRKMRKKEEVGYGVVNRRRVPRQDRRRSHRGWFGRAWLEAKSG